jgi:2,4-didehydro-3-deoxy-L-rhamnonate hydrolase
MYKETDVRFANHDDRLVLVTQTDDELTPTSGIDVAEASGDRFGSDPQSAYRHWPEIVAWARSHGDGNGCAAPVALARERLGPPAPSPRQVFAIGLNYADHAAEAQMEAPAEHPATFTKFPTSLAGPFGEIVLPGDTVDWEVELVAVIGLEASRVESSDAWRHIAGLTVGQDISERSVQLAGSVPQFSLGKSFPGFGPIGPSLVTPDELDQPDDLRLTTSIDDETVQDGRTSQMIFDIPTLVERLSHVVTLLPGDIIFSGTPAGVGAARTPPRFLTAGQTLVSRVEGIGQMRHVLRKMEAAA